MTKLTQRRLLVTSVLPLMFLAGCSKRARGLEDAPIDQRHIDHSPAEVLDFPNQFGNITMKCDHHGHRVYSTTQKAVAVIADNGCPTDWDQAGR